MLFVRQKPFQHLLPSMVLRVEFSEYQKGFQEESNRPNPFRSLMVVDSMGVVIVVIIPSIIVITRVKSFDTHAALFHQDLLHLLKADPGFVDREDLRCKGHCDANVWAELVVVVLFLGAVNVFVDSSSVYSFSF